MKITAILTKPLDGDPEGAEREFDKADFEMLEHLGAVRRAEVAAPAEPTPPKKAEPAPSNKVASPPANKGAK